MAEHTQRSGVGRPVLMGLPEKIDLQLKSVSLRQSEKKSEELARC